MAAVSGGQGRVALVTGGMGGLGETIANKMVDAGYRVVVTYSPGNTKYKDWLKETESQGHKFRAYPCDVSDFDSCQQCVAQIAKEVGPIDILINNAGITRDMTFKKMDKVNWDAVMRTNLDSLFNMSKQVVDGMVERRVQRVRRSRPPSGRARRDARGVDGAGEDRPSGVLRRLPRLQRPRRRSAEQDRARDHRAFPGGASGRARLRTPRRPDLPC